MSGHFDHFPYMYSHPMWPNVQAIHDFVAKAAVFLPKSNSQHNNNYGGSNPLIHTEYYNIIVPGLQFERLFR